MTQKLQDLIDFRIRQLEEEMDERSGPAYETVTISVRIPVDIRTRLEVCGEFMMQSRNSVVRDILESASWDYLKRIDSNPALAGYRINGRTAIETYEYALEHGGELPVHVEEVAA